MLTHLDLQGLAVLGFVVVVAAYFIGSMMDGVLEGDGFGVVGNMVVISSGAFLGFYAVEWLIPYSRDAVTTAVGGVTGGFATLAALAIIKAGLNKAGY